jgi:AmmeMemoRadiSam system protein B/AmmeMemoRadiSam system protein A
MTTVRAMAVSGQFYPDQANVLSALVDEFLADAEALELPHCPKVLIVPHAGLRFSGETAAKAYALLKPFSSRIQRVVMLGPSHRVAFSGIAVEPADSVCTPLGEIPVNRDGVAGLVEDGLLVSSSQVQAQAHAHEHCLEVQWPFLQTVLDDFTLTPLVVGDASKAQVAEVIARLWGGEETLIVISTDLSHFHPLKECEQIDAETCAGVRSCNSDLGGQQACGYMGLNGALYLAGSYSWDVEQVDYSHSAQKGAPADRVVGYGSFFIDVPVSFKAERFQSYESEDRVALLKLARSSIEEALRGNTLELDPDDYHAHLMFQGAAFVSLHKHGNLRGCIGSLAAHQALALDVMHNSVKAAFEDPRFPALSLEELPEIDIEISVLTKPEPMSCSDEVDCLQQLRPGIDGLVIQSGFRRATFLPLVWRSLSEPAEFLKHLKQKAGMPVDTWPSDMQVWRYEAICFSEHDVA